MNLTTNDTIKILLVDDEPGIRNVLKITLEASGYDVCLAFDGENGLDVFTRENPHIVITDIKMPGIDGIELLKSIKQISPDTEVIMITGHGDMALAVKSLKHEAADFITKPIDSNDLETAIKKACERFTITQSIKQYMDDLETLVEEKDKRLNESETMVTIGMTIAGMSHAIKNIAGGLKGSSFVLEQGIEQENREVLTQGWEMMKGNINKITQLSLDLLNYAKTTRLEFKPENPNSPVEDIPELMLHQADLKNIEFIYSPCPEKIKIPMDRDAIQNCILTLVTNAFDAFEQPQKDSTDLPGKPNLVLKQDHTTQSRIKLSVRCQDNHVTYSVKDNGCGVSKAIQSSLFKDFITTKGMNGTGFGLMTTKKIVNQHHGDIVLLPDNAGTHFMIKLPIILNSDD